MSNSIPGPNYRRVRVPTKLRLWLQRIGRAAQAQRLEVYAVGGCVRDWLLGRSLMPDIDLLVVGDGIAFARQLAPALGATLTTHAQFGTATLAWPAPSSGRTRVPVRRLDVASSRKETYREPAAYPAVSAGTLEDDLRRRDFTINAMAMALAPDRFGRLIDPFGGWKDLRAKRLRVLHARSFVDDPSRILRAARFAPRFGCTLESKTAAWLREAVRANLMSRVNRGRVKKELLQMLLEPDPVACLAWLGRWYAGDQRV